MSGVWTGTSHTWAARGTVNRVMNSSDLTHDWYAPASPDIRA